MRDAEKKIVAKRAAQLHEEWRAERQLADGKYRPRITRNKNDVEDVANLPFDQISETNQQQWVIQAEFVERWLAAINGTAEDSSYGPMWLFELLDLPPPSRQLKKWAVREVIVDEDNSTGTKVHRRTYPLEGTPAAQIVPPIKFNVKVPDNIIVALRNVDDEQIENAKADDESSTAEVGAQPAVAVWNAEDRMWTSDGVSDVLYDPKERRLKFQAVAVGNISLVQPRELDVPFRSWEIKQFNFKGALRVSLRTQRNFSIDIKVHNDGCSLIMVEKGEHATPTELGYLIGKIFGARELLEQLAYSGVNLLLTDADASRIFGKSKSRVLFDVLHADIAHAAGPTRFFRSKWNTARPITECVFNIAAAQAEHYDTVRLEVDTGCKRGAKYSVLQVREKRSKFSRKLMQNEVTHARLTKALASRLTPDTLEDLETHQSETATIAHLQRLLECLNLFNFS
jgi:hypothetical protein